RRLPRRHAGQGSQPLAGLLASGGVRGAGRHHPVHPDPDRGPGAGRRQAARWRDRRQDPRRASAGALQGQGREVFRRSHHSQGSQEGVMRLPPVPARPAPREYAQADPLPRTQTMSIKNDARLRRAKTTRSHIRKLGVPRLSVLRTGQHLYAQLFTADGSKVIAAANTLQADVKEGLKNGKNIDAAAKVGKAIAERAKAAGIEKVAFDRSGYRFHGRIKALADAAREGGLQF